MLLCSSVVELSLGLINETAQRIRVTVEPARDAIDPRHVVLKPVVEDVVQQSNFELSEASHTVGV